MPLKQDYVTWENGVFLRNQGISNDCVLKTSPGFLLILLPTLGVMTLKRILNPLKVQFDFNQRYVKSGGSLFTLGKVPLNFWRRLVPSLPGIPRGTLTCCGPHVHSWRREGSAFSTVVTPGPRTVTGMNQDLKKKKIVKWVKWTIPSSAHLPCILTSSTRREKPRNKH